MAPFVKSLGTSGIYLRPAKDQRGNLSLSERCLPQTLRVTNITVAASNCASRLDVTNAAPPRHARER